MEVEEKSQKACVRLLQPHPECCSVTSAGLWKCNVDAGLARADGMGVGVV